MYKSLYANLTRSIGTKFYQNRPDFVEDVTKTFWCVFGSQLHSVNKATAQLEFSFPYPFM